jgi:hypothetical protein
MFTRALAASLIVLAVGCSGITSAKTDYPEAWNVNSSEDDRAKYCDAAQNEGVEKYINDNMLLVGVFVASQKPEKVTELNALVKKLYGGSIKGFAAYATEQCKTWIAPTTTTEAPTPTRKLTMEQFWDAFSATEQADWCYTAKVKGVDAVMVASASIFISYGYSNTDQVDFWTKVCDL